MFSVMMETVYNCKILLPIEGTTFVESHESGSQTTEAYRGSQIFVLKHTMDEVMNMIREGETAALRSHLQMLPPEIKG